MQLHSNRPIKRAGKAGKALRAEAVIILFLPSLGAPLPRRDKRGIVRWRDVCGAYGVAGALWRGDMKKPPSGGCHVIVVKDVFFESDDLLPCPFIELQEPRLQWLKFIAHKHLCHLLNVAD